MRRLRFAIIFIFLAALAATVVMFNATKPRLLILQSYDKTYPWTRDVDVGIRRVLKEDSDYSVRWFYMDTKRHPWSDYKVNIGKTVRKLIDNWQPDVVIAVDDDAQKYAMKYFVNRPDLKIVFSGMNGTLEQYGYQGAPNITGILERKPFDALKETLLLVASARGSTRPVRIMFLGDTSDSVRSDAKDFRKFDWAPVEVLNSRFAKTFDDWKQGVEFAAANHVDYIITANYRRIQRSAGDKTLMSPTAVLKWTEAHSQVPVVGTNAFFVEDGGMLAIGTSPYEQGEVAMSMADRILRGLAKPADIPVQSTHQFVVAMRESGIRKWKIRLPAVYESAARSSANFFP